METTVRRLQTAPEHLAGLVQHVYQSLGPREFALIDIITELINVEGLEDTLILEDSRIKPHVTSFNHLWLLKSCMSATPHYLAYYADYDPAEGKPVYDPTTLQKANLTAVPEPGAVHYFTKRG